MASATGSSSSTVAGQPSISSSRQLPASGCSTGICDSRSALHNGGSASAQASAEAAYDLATQRYRAGLGSYLVVLNAEASVLAQRRLQADLAARALDAQVLLIRALGGGYAAIGDARGGYAAPGDARGGYVPSDPVPSAAATAPANSASRQTEPTA